MNSASHSLFAAGPYRAIELQEADLSQLQDFFERNPQYYLIVSGEPPPPTEAHEEMYGALPDGWPYTKKWIIGFFDETKALVGMANVVSDLLAPSVWHVGFFIVATNLYGGDTARSLYQSLEDWMVASGAKWLRLGIVQGNVRAERFWQRWGYEQVRLRHGVEIGKRVKTIRIMIKRLGHGTLQDYLTIVPRDRKDGDR